MKKLFNRLLLLLVILCVGYLTSPIEANAQEVTEEVEQDTEVKVTYKNQYRVEKNKKGVVKCYYYDETGNKSADAQIKEYFRIVWKDDTTGRAYKNITTDGTLYYFNKYGVGVLPEGYFAVKNKRIVKQDTKDAIIYKCKKGNLSKYTKYARIAIKYKGFEKKLRVKNGKLYTGWHDKQYYYRKGKRVTGWQTLNKKKYYFNTNGVLQKNKIVGTKKSGYYYVDETGVRVSTTEIKQAVKFVVANTKSDQSRSAKLKACYEAMRKYPYYRIYGDEPTAEKIPVYANFLFTKHKANCYRYGSAFAYVAKVLGYESRVCVGKVNVYRPVPTAPHGWAEIKINGTWKMADICIDNNKKNRDLYLLTRKQFGYALKIEDTFVLSVKNGKEKWE